MLALAALTVLATTKATAQNPPGQRYAFIVGIDNYDDRQIRPLTGAVADANAIAAALVTHCHFKPENITLITSRGDRYHIPNRQLLSAWSASYTHDHDWHPNDVAFVFYAGHAFDIGGRAFLIPSDATLNPTVVLGEARRGGDHGDEDRPSNNDLAYSSEQMNVLDAQTVFEIGRLPVNHVLAFYDMCRKSPYEETPANGITRDVFTGSIIEATDISRATPVSKVASDPDVNPSRAVWYACSPNHSSYELNGRGVFSKVLEEALTTSKADANGDGVVTVGELNAYLEKNVPRLKPGQEPYPEMSGPGIDDFPVAWVPKSSSKLHATSQPPVETQNVIAKIDPTPEEAQKDLFAGNVYQFIPGQTWCDVISNEGGFTVRMPVSIPSTRSPVREVIDVPVKEGRDRDKDPQTTKMVTYYYDENRGYLYFRFGASFINYPNDDKKGEALIDWAVNLMKRKDSSDLFGGEFPPELLSRAKANLGQQIAGVASHLTPFGINLGGGSSNEPKDVVESAKFDVGEFPGRRIIMRKRDGSYAYVQIAVIDKRVYIFQEVYKGGNQQTTWPRGYFIDSLTFDDSLKTATDDILPIFNSQDLKQGS
jgi:hypothetical protein